MCFRGANTVYRWPILVADISINIMQYSPRSPYSICWSDLAVNIHSAKFFVKIFDKFGTTYINVVYGVTDLKCACKTYMIPQISTPDDNSLSFRSVTLSISMLHVDPIQ